MIEEVQSSYKQLLFYIASFCSLELTVIYCDVSAIFLFWVWQGACFIYFFSFALSEIKSLQSAVVGLGFFCLFFKCADRVSALHFTERGQVSASL